MQATSLFCPWLVPLMVARWLLQVQVSQENMTKFPGRRRDTVFFFFFFWDVSIRKAFPRSLIVDATLSLSSLWVSIAHKPLPKSVNVKENSTAVIGLDGS